ncbi:hypothetical protein HPCU_00865 [Helicobacter pylori Cuz20]|uniref:Uncharacterized protein n=1 Tax=Helicobacter pylori (strain Cuz20) TaxID=765964 RepID=A0AB32X6I7_HELPC|nr:hypothetical protein HPCU_00865 [Helicobacter pylori Cuz20]
MWIDSVKNHERFFGAFLSARYLYVRYMRERFGFRV